MMNKYLLSALVPMVACYATYAGAETPQTQRVIVSGYGETVEAATKNAATAALEQVVGSFIDANTFLSKKKEISNGLVNQTKTISQNINNYSNGVIESLSVVGTEQNGALYKVTVDAVVRVTELKVVMDQIIGKAKLNSQGLFAQVQTKLDQARNLDEIIFKTFLEPQQDGRAFQITLGNAYLLDDAPRNEFNGINYYFDNYRRDLKKLATIIIPLEIKPKNEYFSKLSSTLKEITSDLRDDPNVKNRYQSSIKNKSIDYGSSTSMANISNGVAISIPTSNKIQYKENFSIENGHYFIKSFDVNKFNHRKISSLKVQIKNKNQQVVLANEFTELEGVGFFIGKLGKTDVGMINLYNIYQENFAGFLQKNASELFGCQGRTIQLLPYVQYRIVLSMNPDKISEAQQIEVSINPN